MIRGADREGAESVLLLGPDAGPVDREDIPALCARARELLDRCDADLVVDAGALTTVDAVAIDAIARLQLAARRRGRRIEVRGACDEIRQLVGLVGLDGVLALVGSAIEPGREPEQREQAVGVEEEADP